MNEPLILIKVQEPLLNPQGNDFERILWILARTIIKNDYNKRKTPLASCLTIEIEHTPLDFQ